MLSQAMYQARDLAMTRMEEEADRLGADGVVGVRLEIGRYEWGENMAEFIAVGTAIRNRGGGCTARRTAGRSPATSRPGLLDAPRDGHRPLGLVMGSCVYHVAHRGMLQTLRQMGQNVELPNFTQALYEAREMAMERMQREAEALKARASSPSGWTERTHGWGSHVIEFFAIGTAIVPTKADHVIAQPTLVLNLNDPPPSLS